MKQWLRVSHLNISDPLKDGAEAAGSWVTQGGHATSLGAEGVVVPLQPSRRQTKGQGDLLRFLEL